MLGKKRCEGKKGSTFAVGARALGRMKMGDRRDGRTDSGVKKRIHDDGIDGIVDNCRTQLRVSRRKWIREEDFLLKGVDSWIFGQN